METSNILDSLIDEFLKNNQVAISKMAAVHQVGLLDDCLAAVKQELAAEFASELEREFETKDLFTKFFYHSNQFLKKLGSETNDLKFKIKSEYICPGCLYLGHYHLVDQNNDLIKCQKCISALIETVDPKMLSLRQAFAKHSRIGYRCQGCRRFIPHPEGASKDITCPYLDCLFIGPWSNLSRMHHPSTRSKKFNQNITFVEVEKKLFPLEKVEKMSDDASLLMEVIESQKNNIQYISYNSTIKHKHACYQAFENLLKSSPEQMSNYLLRESRTGGFQAKIFQEYISILEGYFPFTIKKDRKQHVINSLLDDNLKLFNGISKFDGTVSDKLEIKNGTQEFYVGGRNGFVSQPYYIGKLISIIRKDTGESLMEKVKEYSFLKIKMKDISPHLDVTVSHLRVPPHYQMGGMAHLNRIRQKIVSSAKSKLNKE